MKLRYLAAFFVLTPCAAAPEPADLGTLHWMRGCWGYADAGSRYEEVWLPGAADSLLGLSRRVGADGRTREFEYLRIVVNGPQLDYLAQPGGRPPTRFGSVRIEDTLVVFENPAHDFPQTIRYEFQAPDQLTALISGVSKGKPAEIRFPMRRKSCDGP